MKMTMTVGVKYVVTARPASGTDNTCTSIILKDTAGKPIATYTPESQEYPLIVTNRTGQCVITAMSNLAAIDATFESPEPQVIDVTVGENTEGGNIEVQEQV